MLTSTDLQASGSPTGQCLLAFKGRLALTSVSETGPKGLTLICFETCNSKASRLNFYSTFQDILNYLNII